MIIVAVLLNTVILSVLFMLAITNEDLQFASDIEMASRQEILEDKLPAKLPIASIPLVLVDEPLEEDKLELILSELDINDSDSINRQQEWAIYNPQPSEVETKLLQESHSDNVMEIIVKKGDSLDRIARANATTVQSIKSLNGLRNDHLKIGQVLHVDVGSAKKSTPLRVNQQAPISNIKNQSAVIRTEPIYYTIKSGDSPWKLAKQFNVNMEDLLRLNQLDEEKARNLKIGDKIRVQ